MAIGREGLFTPADEGAGFGLFERKEPNLSTEQISSPKSGPDFEAPQYHPHTAGAEPAS